ncbi:hypothetical protein E3Q06_04296 [Wallemia mellicola]|nr:hypothetical protein E3Q07_04301 [Wallemia mellicola]TIC43917.1 hypothetical protein E3Q06_04296 [Wallemia mellicola]
MTNIDELRKMNLSEPLEIFPLEVWELIMCYLSSVDYACTQKMSLLNRNWRTIMLSMHEPWTSVSIDRRAIHNTASQPFNSWLNLILSRANTPIKRVEWLTDNADETMTSYLDAIQGGKLKGYYGLTKSHALKFRPPPTTTLYVHVEASNASDYFDPDEAILRHTNGLENLHLVNTFPNLLPISCNLRSLSMHFTNTVLDIGAAQNFIADQQGLRFLSIRNLKQDVPAHRHIILNDLEHLELINSGSLKDAIVAPNARTIILQN